MACRKSRAKGPIYTSLGQRPRNRPTIPPSANPITGCGFGRDGAFYVTEFSTHFPTSDLGDVVRIVIKPDGSAGARTTLGVGALHSPNGFASGPDGSIYVSNHSTSTAVDVTPGEVVRVNF